MTLPESPRKNKARKSKLTNQNICRWLSANEFGVGLVVWVTNGRQRAFEKAVWKHYIAIPFDAIGGTEIA